MPFRRLVLRFLLALVLTLNASPRVLALDEIFQAWNTLGWTSGVVCADAHLMPGPHRLDSFKENMLGVGYVIYQCFFITNIKMIKESLYTVASGRKSQM